MQSHNNISKDFPLWDCPLEDYLLEDSLLKDSNIRKIYSPLLF